MKAFDEILPKISELIANKPRSSESGGWRELNDIEFPKLGQRNPLKRIRTTVTESNDTQPSYSALFRDKLIFGSGDSGSSKIVGVKRKSTLRPASRPVQEVDPNMRRIFISRLEPSTSCDQIIEHLKSKNIIDDSTDIKCTKLVKKDANLDELSFVSFKLDVPKNMFNLLNDPSMWPDSVAIREFVDNPPRPKLIATTSKKLRDENATYREGPIDLGSPMTAKNPTIVLQNTTMTPRSMQQLGFGSGEAEAEPFVISNGDSSMDEATKN